MMRKCITFAAFFCALFAAKVRNRRGQVGWSKQDENFGDMDACG